MEASSAAPGTMLRAALLDLEDKAFGVIIAFSIGLQQSAAILQ